eukprot:6292722-Lingulodinium_polyedra.AAC.1
MKQVDERARAQVDSVLATMSREQPMMNIAQRATKDAECTMRIANLGTGTTRNEPCAMSNGPRTMRNAH